jgi:hypothetical protein
MSQSRQQPEIQRPSTAKNAVESARRSATSSPNTRPNLPQDQGHTSLQQQDDVQEIPSAATSEHAAEPEVFYLILSSPCHLLSQYSLYSIILFIANIIRFISDLPINLLSV